MTIQEDIKNVTEMMKQENVTFYPTDTMWGVGCDATNAEAVTKVYRTKKQGSSKALVCLVDSDAWLQRYARQVPNVAQDLLDVTVKPTTIIPNDAINLAPNLIAEDGNITLRVTKEPPSHELCYRSQKALVSISANISGKPAVANYCGISQETLDAADYVCHSCRQGHKFRTSSNIIKPAEDGEVTIIRK